MVRVGWLLVLLTVALAAQAKRIKIYPAEPVLGQAVILSMPADIEFIEQRFNWTALEKCFAVAKADYGSDRVRFTLYPYRVGPCDIRREKWETWEVPSHFNVRPNPAVSVRWLAPDTRVFAREAIVWQAKVQLTEHSGYSVWLEPPGKGSLHYLFSPLKAERLTAVGWMEQQGERWLYSPFVAVKNPSGQIWRFPSPPRLIDIRPLPVYLPADIPVGRMRWQAVALPWLWPRDEVMNLPLKLIAEQVADRWLPMPDQAFPVVRDMRWLVGSRQVETRWDRAGLRHVMTLNQPVQFQAWGWVDLPSLRVRYFDPDTRRLEQATLTLPAVLVLLGWMIWLIKLLLALAGLVSGLVVLYGLWWLFWYGWLWRQRRQTPVKLWAAMRTFVRWTRFRRPPVSLTPKRWQDSLPAFLHPHWRGTVEHLNRALFSSGRLFTDS